MIGESVVDSLQHETKQTWRAPCPAEGSLHTASVFREKNKDRDDVGEVQSQEEGCRGGQRDGYNRKMN